MFNNTLLKKQQANSPLWLLQPDRSLIWKDLDRIFPLLGDLSRYHNIDKYVVKVVDEFGMIEL